LKAAGYGWVVVLCAFTLMSVGFGSVYTFAAFFKAFEAEFAASRAHISLVFSLSAFLYFALGAPAGMLADRYGPRRVAIAGVLCLAAGLAAASASQSLTTLYLVYSLGVGIGVGLTYVPSVGAVQPWFTANRAFATGIAVSGIGAGNVLFPPLAAWLIEVLGWRGAYQALALIALVAAGAAALAIDNRAQRAEQPGAGAPATGMSLGEAMRTFEFRMLYVTLIAGAGCTFVPMVHLGPYAADAGYGEAAAVALVSLIGLGSLLGRFFAGGIADRLGRLPCIAGTYAGLGLMFLLWWSTREYWVLAVFGIAFGAFYGSFVALFPSIAMDLFGPRQLSGIIGTLYTAAGIGTLAGPTLAGAAYDATGSYSVPILVAAAAEFLAAAGVISLILRMRKPATT
jgi:OFA family oxalate/formate antiporter-like MFS transporter